MKILIVNNNFDLKSGGGAERYVLDVVEGLKSRGHTVFTSTSAEDFEKVDVVYVNNCFNTSLLEKLTTKPAVRFVHDHQMYCPGTPKYWFQSEKQCCINTSYKCFFYSFRERCLSRNPIKAIPAVLGKGAELAVNRKFKKLLVASEFMKKMLVNNGFKREQIAVNHLFPYEKGIASDWGDSASPPLILYVGRIFKEKGVDRLIRAAALLEQDFRLAICGAGWDKERCQSIAEALGLENKVEFMGFVPKDKLLKLYKQARLVVVPSVWPEPFGLIGIEAGQYGKPVVGFDSGGVGEWLKDGENGFLVKRLDIAGMAEKMGILLSDQRLAKKMGKAGEKLVANNFSFEEHLGKLEAVFEDITHENS